MFIQKIKYGGNWGLDRIDQFLLPLDGKYHYNRTGFNQSLNLPVDVVIIDSGIEYNHDEFNNRAFPLYDYRTLLPSSDPQYISNTDPRFGVDEYGTGTYMASIIGGKTYGVAKNCRIYGVKVYSEPNDFQVERLINALNFILSWHLLKSPFIPTVIYMPISLNVSNDVRIETILGSLVGNGCIIIVPSGNDNKNIEDIYPQNSNYTIVVGPTTESDYFANYIDNGFFIKNLCTSLPETNTGVVDIYAPGTRIEGIWKSTYENDRIKIQKKILSGSFVAGCFVAGYAALFLEDDFTKTQTDFINFINETCTKNLVKGLPDSFKNLFLFNIFQDANIQIETSGFIGEFEENEDIEYILTSFIRFGSPHNESLKFSLNSGSSLFPNLYLTEDGIIRGKPVSLSAGISGYVRTSASFHIGYVDHYFTVKASSRTFQTTKTLWMRILDKNSPPKWTNNNDNLTLVLFGTSSLSVGGIISANLNNPLIITDEDNNDELEFSILYGDFPSGITLSSNGVIKGTVCAFPISATEFSAFSSIEKIYEFVIRASDGYYITDKPFYFSVLRTSSDNNLPYFEDNSYPDILFEIVQGEGINYFLHPKDPDGDNVLIREVPVSIIAFSADVKFGLPSSLSITTDGKIIGSIDVITSAEKYVFGVEAFDGFSSNIENFAIRVLPFDNQIINLKGSIFWETESFIGELQELDYSHFVVSAIGVSGINIVYEIVSGYSLPPGLQLDSETGEIYGRVSYVPSDQDFTFILRARDRDFPSVFAEKEFTIKVYDRVSGNVCSFDLLGFVDNRYSFAFLEPEATAKPVYKSIYSRYKIDKPEFDMIIPKPLIFLTNGIRLVSDTEVLSALSEDIVSSTVEPLSRYWRKVKLYMGDIVFYEAKDTNGNIIYEVVGIKLVDKLDNNKETTVSSKTFITTSAGYDIVPTCVENMRKDLEYDIGYDNEEILPLHFTSIQTKTSAVPGYQLFLPLMYVKPGFGETIVEELKTIRDKFAPLGAEIIISKLVYKKWIDPNNPETFVINLPVD